LIRWSAVSDNSNRELKDGGIGMLFLSAIESISSIVAERDSSNGIMSEKVPPVIPRDLAKIAPRGFNKVVRQQFQYLNLAGSRGLRTEVQEEFRDF
jgi:hypothetical protein